MTREEFFARWSGVAAGLKRYSSQVDGAALLAEVLSDVETLFRTEESEELTIGEAAEASGYSRDHISRLVRRGAIRNVAARHRPRIRRGDMPSKPNSLRSESSAAILPITSRRQIARSVVNSETRRHDG